MIGIVDSQDAETEDFSLADSESTAELASLRRRIIQLEHDNARLLSRQQVSTKRTYELESALLELESRGKELQSSCHLKDVSEKHYRKLFNLAPVACLSLDHDGIVEKVNLAASCFLKCPSARLLGTKFTAFFRCDEQVQEYLKSTATSRFSNKWQGSIQLPGGGSAPIMLLTSASYSEETEKYDYHVAILDISEQLHNEKLLRNANLFLEELAHHDPLTNLPNRTLFRDNLQSALQRCKRNNESVGLIYFDLDGFKRINDSMGHDVGDRLLKLVAQRVKRLLRANDTSARLGGDEFTVIMDNPASAADALAYANTFADAIREPFHIDKAYINISVSLGLCLYPVHAEKIDDLIKGADVAMYTAKESGGDRVILHSSDAGAAYPTAITR